MSGEDSVKVLDAYGKLIDIPSVAVMPEQKAAELQMADTVTLMRLIGSAAKDEKIDVDKMRDLYRFHQEIVKREAETAFNRDMLEAQESMKPVVRDAINKQQGSRYALLESIDRQIRPIYTSHGFCMTFNTGQPREKGAVRMMCDVRHIGGHVQPYELEGALDLTGDKGTANKTSIKALGSTNSYLRRYLTLMVWNIQLINEDDDGEGASALTPEQLSNVVNMLNACDIKGERLTKFLEFARAPRVEDIIQAMYAEVMTKLRTEHRKQRES